MPADRNLNHLFPAFRAKVQAIADDMNTYAEKNMPGYEWIIVEGFRTAQYQHDLYLQGRGRPGRVVTDRDGYKRRSNHQSSLAADFAPQEGNSIDWTVDQAHWDYLGHVARSHGLAWGGDWKGLVDRPHVEWPESDATTYAAALAWQKEQGLG